MSLREHSNLRVRVDAADMASIPNCRLIGVQGGWKQLDTPCIATEADISLPSQETSLARNGVSEVLPHSLCRERVHVDFRFRKADGPTC